MQPLAATDLVLASTSPYRRELLTRLTSSFRQMAPEVDEASNPGELPAALAQRLAAAKAHAVAALAPGALVIGSDQVAERGGMILGKPHTHSNAARQLRACSGNTVVFHTAVCLIDARTRPLREFAALDTTQVHFRSLEQAQITRYLEREQPFDCAGSFKAERLGIALFESITCTDPTALIGLPLIALCRLLGDAGIDVI